LCAAVLQAPAAPAASSAVVAKPGYPAECPWMNTAKSADQRARTLLANSSLEQELRWLVEQPATQPTTTTFSGVSHPAQLP
jgi:beta-glucosidase